MMEKLKRCPLCKGRAMSKARGNTWCMAADGDCKLAGVPVPIDAWQTLPRLSNAARKIAGELRSIGHRHCDEVVEAKLWCLATRLESLAETPAPPAEVWVSWIERDGHHRIRFICASEALARKMAPSATGFVSFPVHGTPTQGCPQCERREEGE